VALPAIGADQPQRFSSVVRPDLRTGKLVRSVVVAARPVNEQKVAETLIRPRVVSGTEPLRDAQPAPLGIDETVNRIAAEHGLSAALIHSVIKVESNYNPYAVSSKGALGIMQLIPETARRFGVANVFNPEENIRGGAKYLRYLLDLFGNTPLALAAYNAGEAAVAKYGGIPPFAETQNYVILVARQLAAANKAAAAKSVAVAKPKLAPADPDSPAHIVEERQPDGSVHYVTR